ncbi:uncharacterized protein LOC133634970 [Entelurus aequoreus]|uniref:uncharacterized protein LOC133634970 n=1 Tax=Entelurus aequoreus TaxID=161455 RepID=UPI002B1E001B|nr:uncharacterized protein LOC133634970 [Entelurus aequoreus]
MLKHVQAVHNRKVRERCRVFDTWRSSDRDDEAHPSSSASTCSPSPSYSADDDIHDSQSDQGSVCSAAQGFNPFTIARMMVKNPLPFNLVNTDEYKGHLWIYFSCHSKISKGQIPAECWNNNLAVHPIPPELGCLNSLEQHLIALRIPFMKAVALPKGGQNGVHGPVTCVPANIVQTTNVLPRSSMEGSLLQVKLKRKLTYKGHYEYQFVDSWRVRRAIEYLKRTNVLYKDIEFNEEWSNAFCREEEVVEDGQGDQVVVEDGQGDQVVVEDGQGDQVVVEDGQAGQGDQVVVDPQFSEDEAVEQKGGPEEESEDIVQDELLHDRQQHCMFQDTCLMPVDIGQEALVHYFKDVVCLAPAEGNSPVRMLSDKFNEAMCFPALFPNSRNTFHADRAHRITLLRYFNNRVMHADGRFARNVEYIFFCQYMSELDQVISSISVAMRKGKGGQHSQRILPDMLKDDESLKRLLQFDDGFRFLRPIRGTPAFWSSVQKDLMACVRQLGIPTWFCSFSSADLRWQNLLASILRQEGRQQTVEQLEWADRCELLRRNPATAARMFDYRWHCFLKEVLMSPSNPVGKILDFFYRIEFQQRGSPHVHALFWIEGAPQFYKNPDLEVAQFIDQYVTCELPSADDTLSEVVSSVQLHSKRHSKSCRKNNTKCRFNFPKPISARTFICKIPECVCPKKATGTESECLPENRPKCTCLDKDKKMRKEVAQMIMEKVMDAMEREEPFGSVEELFASVGINQDVFELAYWRLETKNKVVYRRGVNDTWVNQYNKNLLKCWNANMDISFVTDAYAVVIYIIKYITKAENEIGLLLSNALKEANKLGNLSAKEALKKLGSVYLHNRDVCAQEAVYRLMSMHLKECSRKVVFIPTGNNIVRMSLPLSVLLQRASSEGLRSENMWMTSVVERYQNRPDGVVFADMCIATFCSEYRVLTKNEDSDKKIALQGGLGFILRRTRTQFAVVRYMRFKLDKQEEAHFQSLLQLFLPYRTDCELKPEGFDFYKQFHDEGNVTLAGGTARPVRDVVDDNRAKFEVDCPRLEHAQELADLLGPNVDEDAWGDLRPEQEIEHMECLEERQKQQQGEISDEQLVQSEENVPDLFVGGKQVATIERNTNILSRREGLALLHSLNETQRSVLDRIRKWCLEKVRGKNPEPFHVFVTGKAGTGKSHLIRAIQYEAGRLLSRLYKPDETCVLLTAPTGIAAYSLHAATIHHTFSIGIQVSLPYIPLGEDKINSLRAQFGHLQILIIDEISKVDHHLLVYVHGRLRQMKQTGDFSPFGNVSVVAVGDFYQLPPVKGKPLYASQVGVDLWCHFTKVALTTVVRQKDSVFSELLNRLRVRAKGTPLLQSDVDILKSRETGEESAALHIYPTNMQTSHHNLERLFAICPDYVTIEAQDFINSRKTGQLEHVADHHAKTSYTCLVKSLCLAPNARVMLCKNIAVADGLVNGACGTVTYIHFGADKDFPLTVYVKFDDPKIGSQRRKERSHAAVECPHSTAIDPVEDSATKCGGLRRQFPLKLAWACTVHKVQGLTVDEAVVCLHKVFAAGQAYVALSRVRDISGLVITDFKEKAIYCKDAVKEALDSMPPFLLEQPQPSLEPRSFSAYLLNVQSLPCHAAHLMSCTQHLQPTCIAVTETWLTAQSPTDCVQIQGYTFHSRPRALCYSSNDFKLAEIRDLQHGGVGLYVVDNSDCEILQVPDLNLECLVCLFTKENILMAVIYRPPSYPNLLFKSNLVKLLDWVTPLSNTIVIMGDFNEDLLKHSSISKLMGQNGFSQHVTQATTENGTLIDHIYVKTTQYAVDCAVLSTYFSDHEAILCAFRGQDEGDAFNLELLFAEQFADEEAWYEVEKANLISQLEQVSKVAITADGWTAVTQDHYLSVTVHYVSEGQLTEKVLNTRAEEIDEILEEFKIQAKVVAATVDNAANMNVAPKKLHLLNIQLGSEDLCHGGVVEAVPQGQNGLEGQAATVDNAANMNVAPKKLHLLKFGRFAHTLNVPTQGFLRVTLSGLPVHNGDVARCRLLLGGVVGDVWPSGAGRREQVPAVRGEPAVIREEPAIQEEAQVPLQVFKDKVAFFPLPSDSGSVSKPQSVRGRVAMVERDRLRISPGPKPFELCGVRVSGGASPALSGASVESCIFEMNTAAAPELSDINDVCATTSLFESDAGPAVSHAQSGVSVESGFIEMSTAPAPGLSDLEK